MDSSGAPGSSSGADGSGFEGSRGPFGSDRFSGESGSGDEAGMLGARGSGFGFTGGASIETILELLLRMVMDRSEQQAFHADDHGEKLSQVGPLVGARGLHHPVEYASHSSDSR